jgi:hypothetical protein
VICIRNNLRDQRPLVNFCDDTFSQETIASKFGQSSKKETEIITHCYSANDVENENVSSEHFCRVSGVILEGKSLGFLLFSAFFIHDEARYVSF